MPDPDAPITDEVRHAQAPLERKETTVNDEQTLPTVEEDESGRPIYTAEKDRKSVV